MSQKKKKAPKVDEVPEEVWRANVRQKLQIVLGESEPILSERIEDAVYHRTILKTTEIDRSILAGSRMFKQLYLYHIQSIILNLDPNSHVKNKNLITRVLSKEVSPEALAQMSAIEMFPERWEQIKNNQSMEDQFRYDSKLKATSKRITCMSCKKNDIFVTEKQIRSADEPMTSFFSCLNCGAAWRS